LENERRPSASISEIRVKAFGFGLPIPSRLCAFVVQISVLPISAFQFIHVIRVICGLTRNTGAAPLADQPV
jgi:hypothetical protein